ncbi:ATP-dependent Clp protease adaptor ClpS [Luteimonas sp. SJ-92]|uniref:ATP-dependent Clp protease adaptor ClpS n=1 Tax=Luteimonas salinisoli TaxID=2752307 RepID=A0A853JCZ3_9GAMM|nr:ATP-dependent Clp protease adaptor ClpS [Luteimonas salinisoli]NZA27153.1 ATP-dependent Clp protease adaptor ClpS [Luteimonas salinisoli]
MKNAPEWIGDLSITLHDDDDTAFETVVALLRRCLGLDGASAVAWARHLHRNGQARLGPWSAPVARAIHGELLRLSAQYGCAGLRPVLEDASAEAQEPHRRASQKAHHLLGAHFGQWDSDSLQIVKREFPIYLRVDVQRAVEALTGSARRVGIHSRNRYEASDLAALLSERNNPKLVGALEFEDVDIGEDRPARLATNCLSLIEDVEVPLALWMNHRTDTGDMPQLGIELLAPPGEAAARRVAAILEAVESAVAEGQSYRGKILSLEASETYRGLSAQALTVHDRSVVTEDELILPREVRQALERHVVEFAADRPALKALGQPTRKGVLLYGPPGTGKTHTIRYLAHRLADHTTFLVTAEQAGLIDVYFRLARLFAPSILVIEDADLIARQRGSMDSVCEEALLNRLLNEMDGLRRDADIFVIMTTNRPETLETALVQRPGRIDHAIEVPVPDAACRRLLLQLYGDALEIAPDLQATLVDRTEGVSAAFIKEIARRLAQQSIRAGHPGRIEPGDMEAVLGEMLSERDGLSLRLMGGAG